MAEVVVKEGPESLGVLRKTGRGGWDFFTETVLPNKKKLIAAGVLAAFLADPDKFVDTAGRATEYAVRQFARAGVDLVGAVERRGRPGAGSLDRRGPGRLRPELRRAPLPRDGRWPAWSSLGATLVLLGLPVRWMLRPFTWPFRMVFGRRKPATKPV